MGAISSYHQIYKRKPKKWRFPLVHDSGLLLAEESEAIRTVRLLQRLEHTSVFELLVFADIIPEHRG